MHTQPNAVDRRRFLAGSGLAAAGLLTVGPTHAAARGGEGQPPASPKEAVPQRGPAIGDSHRGPCVIASGNGPNATERAFKVMSAGVDPCEAVVAGVKLVEDDPKDTSVGYGGLPNEDGVVELDASVMHGPTHKAGAVAGLRNIKNPAAVALRVLQRTDHVLLVGEGALRFARAQGFKEENLLTPESHAAWLRWKEAMGADDWLNPEERDWPRPGKKTLEQFLADEAKQSRRPGDEAPIPFTWGTIHCSAVNGEGDVGACTTTSGLSWKIPGRVGDSPIIGAGMYCENEVGAAGSTGRGESLIVNCGSFTIVQYMAAGMSPTEACLAALKRIVDRTREKRLLNEKGRPNFNASVYALRKDGAYGGACIYPGGTFAVTTNDGATKVHPCAPLFESQ